LMRQTMQLLYRNSEIRQVNGNHSFWQLGLFFICSCRAIDWVGLLFICLFVCIVEGIFTFQDIRFYALDKRANLTVVTWQFTLTNVADRIFVTAVIINIFCCFPEMEKQIHAVPPMPLYV